MSGTYGTNTGHGHVWERPDGAKARCGGPAICAKCASDFAQVHGHALGATPSQTKNATLKARLERTEARVAELDELRGLAEVIRDADENEIGSATIAEWKWTCGRVLMRLANTTPAKPETHGGE